MVNLDVGHPINCPQHLDRVLFFVYNRFVAFEMRFYEFYED